MKNIFLLIGMMILVMITAFSATILNNDIVGRGQAMDVSTSKKGAVEVKSNFMRLNSKKADGGIPVVNIRTDGTPITKEEIIWSEIEIIDNANDAEDISDNKLVSTIKYRGNSSYEFFDKKQYRIEFYKKKNGNKKKKISVMGMSKECDWVLNGPFLDRSLIRNKFFYDISREIMEWAPDSRFCEVFIDGRYMGVYLMVESVKVSEDRIKLKEFSLLDGKTSYLLRRERDGSEENAIATFGTYAAKSGHELSVDYPSRERLLDTQKEWIRKDISEFERVLYSDFFDDKERGYAKYIDLDSFVDYYIINEYAMNCDAGYLSTYVYKDIDGKLKMAVWDFNNSFDNYPWYALSFNQFYVAKNNWYNRLFQDRAFTEEVVKRYRNLRDTKLKEERLLKAVDAYVEFLGHSVDRNFEVWGYTFKHKLLNRGESRQLRDPRSYEEAVNMVKDAISKRGKFMDENIESLYQYSIN